VSTTKTLHRHQCQKCGCVWKHHPATIRNHSKAHNCPVCGKNEGWIYEGLQRAHRPSEIAEMREKFEREGAI
jgi:predicted RNA-binding Zn-ribbon protein involved in translation (DUF1610 family)